MLRAGEAGCASHPGSGLLLTDGLAVFQAFLRTEFSEENLEFWLACEDFKKVKSQSKMAAKAKKIFAEYIAIQACKEVRTPAGPSAPSPCPRGLLVIGGSWMPQGGGQEGERAGTVCPGWRGSQLGPREELNSVDNKSGLLRC